jgi:flagellar hook-associated protein 3 FlgL
MKTTFTSTRAISEATRVSLVKMQARLIDAQKELASGRLADIGKSLGHKAGETVLLRQEHTRLTAMIEANGEVTTRVDIAQTSLKSIIDSAQEFLSQLIGARSSESGPPVIRQQAENGLKSIVDALNSNFNGVYLFSGINADVEPLQSYYQTPPSAAQQGVAAEFLTAFGVAQGDPATQSITPAAMQAFLDGPFTGMFDGPAWTADWSSASDQNMRSRISTYELLDSGTNTNEAAFRQLVSAYTMVADLGVETLAPDTYQTVVDKAVELASQAIQGMSEIQSKLGIVQERTSNANERMAIQIDILSVHIGTLESVDPYEASTRITALMTQIETAYALTSRIQQMSLLNYL